MSEQDDRVQIRLARLADDVGLAAIDAAAWTSASGFPSLNQARREVFFTPDSPPEAHLVAELAGQLAGYLRLKPASKLPENAHVLMISGLAVAPGVRRAGLGAALLAAAMQEARRRGARKVTLRVLGTNAPAIALYERLGFEREGLQREEFLIEGQLVDDWLMAKWV